MSQRVKLTDAFCRGATVKPGQRVTVYSDTEMRGFCLVVTEAGSKSFAVRYTLKDGDEAGKQARVTLGPYLGRDGKAVTTYRTDAAKAIGDAARGIDKAATRKTMRKAITIGDLCKKYMREHAAKKRTGATDGRRLEKYVLPVWKHRKAVSIRRSDVSALLAPIANGDGKELRGRPVEANRVLSLVQKLFSFAVEHEHVDAHPCTGMKKPGDEQPRQRELTDPHELRAFYALTEPGTYMPAGYAAALRMQLLTGTRPGEAIGMRWDEIDQDQTNWIIPKARIKTGRRKHAVDHLIPLTSEMRAIIEAQAAAETQRETLAKADGKSFSASPYVFPAPRGGKFTDKRRRELLDLALDAYKAAGGKLARFTPHDLRRTAETAMAAAKVPQEYRDRVLNHVDNSTGGKTYNRHDYRDEKADALARLSAWIHTTLLPPGGNVSQLRRKA
jgi:integrase